MIGSVSILTAFLTTAGLGTITLHDGAFRIASSVVSTTGKSAISYVTLAGGELYDPVQATARTVVTPDDKIVGDILLSYPTGDESIAAYESLADIVGYSGSLRALKLKANGTSTQGCTARLVQVQNISPRPFDHLAKMLIRVTFAPSTFWDDIVP